MTTALAGELQGILDNANGTENYYKHSFSKVFYTDGVKLIAEKAGAYWLIDAILSYRRKEEFQIWTLDVADKKGILTMQEDPQEPVKVKQVIEYTDFPSGVWKFYLTNGVLYLPSEE